MPKPQILEHLERNRDVCNVYASECVGAETISPDEEIFHYRDESRLQIARTMERETFHFFTKDAPVELIRADVRKWLASDDFDEENFIGEGQYSTCFNYNGLVLKKTRLKKWRKKETKAESADYTSGSRFLADAGLMTSANILKSWETRGMRVPAFYGFSIFPVKGDYDFKEFQYMEFLNAPNLQDVLNILGYLQGQHELSLSAQKWLTKVEGGLLNKFFGGDARAFESALSTYRDDLVRKLNFNNHNPTYCDGGDKNFLLLGCEVKDASNSVAFNLAAIDPRQVYILD